LIHSMTAYGRAQREEAGYSITVEIKALNGKFLDIAVRLPRNFLEFEEPLRKQIAQMIRRGRIEAHVQIESTAFSQKAPRLNLALARRYWDQLQELHRSLPGAEKPTLGTLLRIPYIFETREAVEDRELLRELLAQTVSEALVQMIRSRAQEGEALLQDLLTRLTLVREELSLIESRKDLVLQEYQVRLRERMEELLKDVTVDEGRLLQEIGYLAERSDINEELVRLQSHLDQLGELVAGDSVADGRRLDFLIQELHRESNTIGSKTNDLETVQAVVRMKSEIGKLKEQVQNVE
jgi:uncharacterized protein (TIGR00255 family)